MLDLSSRSTKGFLYRFLLRKILFILHSKSLESHFIFLNSHLHSLFFLFSKFLHFEDCVGPHCYHFIKIHFHYVSLCAIWQESSFIFYIIIVYFLSCKVEITLRRHPDDLNHYIFGFFLCIIRGVCIILVFSFIQLSFPFL